MKPTKIAFTKAFYPMQYHKEEYFIEMLLEEGDSLDDAYKAARNIVTEQFKKDNPQITWNDTPDNVVFNDGSKVKDYAFVRANGIEIYDRNHPPTDEPLFADSKPPYGTGINVPIEAANLRLAKQYQKQRPKDRTEAIIFDIGTCSEMKVLESYAILAKNNPKIKEAYDKKKKELI